MNFVLEEKESKTSSNLRLLSEINKDKDIKQGAHAIYPGPRCPLALVTNVFSRIKGVSMLIVGTAECTYYNRNIAFSLRALDENNTVWSYSLEPKEVIFGCREGIINALNHIDKTGAEVIVMVSACVPEMIGEDFQGIVWEANSIVKAKVIYINGAHFKCYSPIPAKENSLTALCELMEKQQIQGNTVNILGDEGNHLKSSELMTMLRKYEVKINCVIPNKLSIDELRKAPSASLSIVTDMAALSLAKKMHEKFGTPYVLFPHFLDVKSIKEAYEAIGKHLDIAISQEVASLYERAEQQIEHYASRLRGKSFAIGYLSVDPFVAAAFLSSLGVKPVYIEVEYYFAEHKMWSKRIIDKGYNPYVARTFNYETIKEVLESDSIDYFIGYGGWKTDYKKNFKEEKWSFATAELGFEQPLNLLKKLVDMDEAKFINSHEEVEK